MLLFLIRIRYLVAYFFMLYFLSFRIGGIDAG